MIIIDNIMIPYWYYKYYYQAEYAISHTINISQVL